MELLLPTAIWLFTALLICEYAGDRHIQGNQREDSTPWTTAACQVVLTSIASALAVLPILSPASFFGLLALAAFQEFQRKFLGNRTKDHPLNREILFFLGMIVVAGAWLSIFATSAHARGPGIQAYTDPNLLKSLSAGVGLLLVTRGGTIIIQGLLRQMGKEYTQESQQITQGPQQFKVGRMIGNLERILMFCMALANQWTAIGFVLAAKSIARFKKLEEQTFAEYYLLGTLASALVALAVAQIVLRVWSAIS
jgi:hypothetical protein